MVLGNEVFDLATLDSTPSSLMLLLCLHNGLGDFCFPCLVNNQKEKKSLVIDKLTLSGLLEGISVLGPIQIQTCYYLGKEAIACRIGRLPFK